MYKYRKIIGHITACLSVVLLCDYASAEEITPFQVTGVDGEVYIRYFNDEYRDKYADRVTSERAGETLEEGLDLTIHSYIYHPNFFRLDFGGGPVFIQQTYDAKYFDRSYKVENSNNEQFLNLHADANILEKKPYPVRLFYDRHSSTTPYAVQDRMLLTHEKYGLNFKLRRPLIPALVLFDYVNSKIDGDNLQRITDEETDLATLKISGDLGSNGDGSLGYTWTKADSASCSRVNCYEEDPITGDPIRIETKKITRLLDAWTDHKFGYDKWVRLTNKFIFKQQDNLPELEEIRYDPNLYLTHARNLKSYYRYRYLDRAVEGIYTTAHALEGGVSHTSFNDQLDTDIELHGDQIETEGAKQRFYQGDINLSYLQPFENFNVRYTGGWGIDYTDRVTDSDTVPVAAEQHILTITDTTFTLNQQNVVEDTIEMKDIQDNVIPTEFYRVITRGEITEIQYDGPFREDPTNPGQMTVFVNYEFQSGGTADFIGYRQLYGIELNQGNILRLYGRYRSLEHDLQSGTPSVPLNDKETWTFGLNVDYPLATIWMLGGRAEYEDETADVGSYRRQDGGVYVQVQIPRVFRGSLRGYADRLLVDHLESPEDVDLTRFGGIYHGRLGNRTTLNIDYVEEEDVGGTNKRAYTRGSARLGWIYRKLNFTAEYRYFEDKVGLSERDRNSLNLLLSRRF